MSAGPSLTATPPATAPHRATADSGAALLGGHALLPALLQVLSSQAVLVAAGIGCLPLLTRNLGPALYGQFSLYLFVAGLAAQLDVSRPLLVRDLARGESGRGSQRRDAETLGLINLALLATVGGVAGGLLLGPVAGAALAASLALHAFASRRYALLAAHGRIGLARTVRNVAWALAMVSATALSFRAVGPHAWLWCFPLANLAILLVYGGLLRGKSSAVRTAGIAWPRWHAASWQRHGHAIRNVLGHSLAVMVLVSVDRAWLRWSVSDHEAGLYLGQYDLAVKLHVLSSALGQVLYPLLSRAVGSAGEELAARRFVRLSARLGLAYFAGILVLMLLYRQVVGLMLGPEYLAVAALLPWMLVGVFLGLFGFLVSAWQRARGEFAAHRRAYWIAAVVMVACAAVLIPRLGVQGAALTYLSGRTAEVLVIASEVGHLPRRVLPRRLLVGLALLLAVLVAVAATLPGVN